MKKKSGNSYVQVTHCTTHSKTTPLKVASVFEVVDVFSLVVV
jgi:hypothetical protein